MIMSFSDLPRETKKYQGNILRPLYVVLLTTKETMNEFAMATRQIDISFPVWLVMFLPYRGDPMKSFCQNPTGNPFNLVFNTEMLILCYNLPILNEWYALRDNRTRVSNLAIWNASVGFRLSTNSSLYARRNNMFGEVMRVAYVEDSPFVTMVDGVLSQFFGNVIQELSEAMNFTIEVIGAQAAYGNWNKDEQTWTGVIGEVVSNRVDFGVAEFTITKHRLDVVDFTLPLILSRNKVYFKKHDASSVQWSAYFKAFNMDIWAAIICIIVSVPIVLTVMKTRGRVVMRIMADNYIHVWGIYCQQGLSEFPDESPLRLAFLSIFVSSLIILSAYSASLISFLTISTVSLPFTTLEGFAHHGSYKLIVFKNSADYDMIVSANDSVSLKLTKLMKQKQDLPLMVLDGFEQVCSGTVGFYITEAIKNAMSYVPCHVSHIEADRIDSLALALRKGSPYTGLVNYQLQRFKDNGVLNKLRKTHTVTVAHREDVYPEVTLGGIAPILAVLAGGVIFGCFILLLERICYKYWGGECSGNCSFVRKFKKAIPGKACCKSKRKREAKFKSHEKHVSSQRRTTIGYCP
ncbi:glutamate receptor ionotropic, delta-2 isoform X2 [Andrena cerasifolii]